MLYEAFGYEVPEFGHLSIILGPDRQKLSKRHGATSVFEYRERGYLPEALNNFVALLGWSSPEGDEVMGTKDIIRQFNLERFHSAPAVFDELKLKWMNSVHLRALPTGDLWSRVKPLLDAADLKFEDDVEWQERSLSAFKTSMETLKDAVELYRPLADNQYSVKPDGLAIARENRAVVEAWLRGLETVGDGYLDEDGFHKLQTRVQEECKVNGKNLFQPLRVAVVGVPQGVELKKLTPLLKVKSLRRRAQECLKVL
jgi:nondiscriminating glutamyl-tRNA synthetase